MASIVTGLPKSTEKANITQGRYGARKENTPRKLMRACSFRRPQTYVIMKVRELPRKWTLQNGATSVIMAMPNNNIRTKLAVRPRKSPSSSSRQYRTCGRCGGVGGEGERGKGEVRADQDTRVEETKRAPVTSHTYQKVHME